MSVVDRMWDEEIVPALTEFIRIPNLSPEFDPAWAEHGHMAEAAELVRRWCEAHAVPGATVDLVELPDLTPVLVVDVPASAPQAGDDTVVLYGHLDKQPEMTGWREGLGPWTPVLEGDRLYGRGGADDGYAAFASLAAIAALRDAGRPHARCVVLIEATEESGSPHLPPYLDLLADRIGEPSLVVCLDSSCPTWDRLWTISSLRGMIIQNLTVEVLTEGVHSGLAGGIVPDSFRLLRSLLSRVEDEATGELLVPELRVEIPSDRRREAEATAAELGAGLADWPFVPGAGPTGDAPVDWLLNKSWRASLATTGIDGMPSVVDGGNVLRPFARAKLALRVPPTADARAAAKAMAGTLGADPPNGARVTVETVAAEDGWNAPSLPGWLSEAVDRASIESWGRPARAIGEGGTIPFIGMLATRFPEAQFVVTGVLGPGSNAHGPNEFLDVPTGKRVTHAVASILADHAARPR